jgi:hypothetical protein
LSSKEEEMPTYRVTTHTSYDEVFELSYDGPAETLFDQAPTADWKRVSPETTRELVDASTKVESIEEVA